MILASDEPRRWASVAEITRRMASVDAPEPLQRRQVIAHLILTQQDYDAGKVGSAVVN